jgi:predicted nucleotidyltransferase
MEGVCGCAGVRGLGRGVRGRIGVEAVMTPTREQVLDLLADRREELARRGVRTLALFGSVARGEARADSDVDFLVEFKQGPSFNEYADLANYLEDLMGCRVDLVPRTWLRPELRDYVRLDLRYVPGLSPVP